MKLRAILACVVCRATHGILRLMKKGATSLPGRLALAICPDILSIAAKNVSSVAVTGTNGKTTGCRMLQKMLENDGKDPLCDRSGANLRHGITTAFVMNLSLSGRPRKKYAVVECDEAAARTVLAEIRPKVLLFTNLFRDQEDRYGSVMTPFEAICEGLSKSPLTVLCTNGDSPFAALFDKRLSGRCRFYGMSFGSGKHPDSGESDTCPICGGKLRYSRVTYANLGDYRCTRCGAKRPRLDFSGEEYFDALGLRVRMGESPIWLKPALPGLHNAYNALGALCAAKAFGISESAAVSGAESFERGFGRMEDFPLGRAGAQMILVKNAAAMNRTLAYLESLDCQKTLVFIQNANAGDGRDLNWLSDCDFEKLQRRLHTEKIIVSGEARDALQDSLTAAKVDFETADGTDELMKMLENEQRRIFLLPSYTAMIGLRKAIVKRLGGTEFWE